MATIGTLPPFDRNMQTWEEYCEIMEHFFIANDVDDEDKKKSRLLSVVGAQTYSLMRNLLSPAKPGEKTFAQLEALLKKHFNPKPSEIVQRFKFDSRMRKPTESVAEYMAEIRKLSQDCNYGETLSQMLLDRLVCGINDDRIQRRLLSETALTFESALSLAQGMESANKNVQDLQMKVGAMSCNAMKSGESKSYGKVQIDKECYRCKGKHAPTDCRFKKEKCHACGMIGHIARACRNKKKDNAEKWTDRRPREGRGRRFKQERNVHYCSSRVAEESDKDQPLSLYHVQGEDGEEREPPYKVCMDLNGEPVEVCSLK
ncbi:uncharacterized protein LOC127350824 [Dicentrarchus labrax]|uniref:uncharacterized protein LOC127350824 n=1 Tax=Dicentrarchus labrax TaxID=13489 RepID=UPI0021F621F3|nr:uncharacterized protein LOC127350824 [Dicentrarchus labrax]